MSQGRGIFLSRNVDKIIAKTVGDVATQLANSEAVMKGERDPM